MVEKPPLAGGAALVEPLPPSLGRRLLDLAPSAEARPVPPELEPEIVELAPPEVAPPEPPAGWEAAVAMNVVDGVEDWCAMFISSRSNSA